MAFTLEEWKIELAKLPDNLRAEIATFLIDSLDPEPDTASPEEIEAAWERELERRFQRYREGKMPGIPASTLFPKFGQKDYPST